MNKKMTTRQWNKTVLAAMSGDKDAFEEICRQKSASILFICKNILHNWQDAEDATQEILTTMHEKIHTLNSPESFSVWLNKMSYNTSISMRRKQMKELYNISFTEDGPDLQEYALESLPAELLETKESREKVMAAIKTLPTNYRMAIIFYYYNGLRAKEIAEVMDTTEKAVENYLYRGRLALKSSLDSRSPQQKDAAMSAVLLGVFQKTDLPIAAQRSAQLLGAMGITASPSSIGTAAGAMALWKAVGGVVLSGSIITATAFATMQGTSAAGLLPSQAQSPATGNVPFSSASLLFPNQLAEENPQLSQQGTPAQAGEAPSITPYQTSTVLSARIMGRIYLSGAGTSTKNTPWNVPGVAVHLLSADDSSPPQATKTMAKGNPGWFLFDAVKPGKYKLKIDLPPYLFPSPGSGYSLQNGYLSYNGSTIFELGENATLNHSLPVTQTGSIQGKITTSQPSLENQLGGIAAQLYDTDGYLLMTTYTQADGSYRFEAPPLVSRGRYTIQFYGEPGAGLTLLSKSIAVDAEPGKNIQAQSVEAADLRPPALEVIINNGSGGPAANRSQAFAVRPAEPEKASIRWEVRADAAVLAAGTGSEPGDALDGLPPGSYLLFVTVADPAGNTESFRFILQLA